MCLLLVLASAGSLLIVHTSIIWGSFQQLLEEGINAVRTESLPEACALALRACSPVVILGTTSLVSEAERLSF